MCLANASEKKPFKGVSIAGLIAEVQRLTWEADVRERELERLIYREKKIGHLFLRMKRVLRCDALPEIKLSVLKALCDRGPIFPPPTHAISNPDW